MEEKGKMGQENSETGQNQNEELGNKGPKL